MASPRALSTNRIADEMPAQLRKSQVQLDRELELAPQLGRSLSYGQIADLVVASSGWLAAAGARAGDRVAVVMRNSVDIPVLALACQRIGVVPLLVSGAMQPREAATVLQTANANLLVTDRSTLDSGALCEDDPALHAPRVCVVGERGRWEFPQVAATPPDPYIFRSGDEHALITHSSGTTGIPKLVVQSIDSFNATVRMNLRLAKLVRMRGPIAGHMSLAHLRSIAAFAALLRLGQPVLALTGNDPEAAMRLLAEFKPRVVEAHPASFVSWEPYIDRHPAALACVRLFASNFDAAHPRTIRALLGASRRRMPIYIGVYGQSESGPITARVDTRMTAAHADGRCVGFPLLGQTHLRIARGADASARSGAIEVRSSGLAVDYLDRTDLYRAKRHGDWWEMQDLGYRTRFGCLHLLDRAVDAISGVPSLLAIEDCLMGRLPQIREAVLIPNSSGAPTPVVATYDGNPVPEESWLERTADLNLAAPQWRSYDELPITATGKVQRHRLADLVSSDTYVAD